MSRPLAWRAMFSALSMSPTMIGSKNESSAPMASRDR